MSSPAAAYTPPVDQPPPATVAQPYGGFWIRVAAHLVDGFIIWLGLMVLSVVLALVSVGSGEAGSIAVGLAMLALPLVYHAGFVASNRMATPGKRLCGLYVTGVDGHRIGFGRALWRQIAVLFSYLTFFIGFIMAGLTARKQALHDKLAGTLVHRQPGSAAVVVIVIVVLAIAVVGILAAIFIPAYNDSINRAKVAGVISSMSAAKTPIAEHAMNKGGWPTTWEQVEAAGGANPMRALPEASRAMVEGIRLEANGVIAASVKIGSAQGQIRLTPRRLGDSIEWSCASSQPIWSVVPSPCRN
jgi:uncharacterized RDD family membrane protein YckC/Tfp pilus assembly major pilin PilA